MKKTSMHVFANWMFGEGLSGGDRILIECLRHWGVPAVVNTSVDGSRMFQAAGVQPAQMNVWSGRAFQGPLGKGTTLVARTAQSLMRALRYPKVEAGAMLYSASDFWPDALPAWIVKLKNPKAKWVAGFYLFAPSPWSFFRKEARRTFRPLTDVAYWVLQWPVRWVVRRWADAVCVTSEPDRERFVAMGKREDQVVVVRGGVFVPAETQSLPKKYDACFLGRFHPQKGALELVEIWSKVHAKRPGAKLAMIGNGELEPDIRRRIQERGLNSVVELLGFLDGEPKHAVFRQSRLMVHPALYDSGGMSAAEGMAWGLPAVGFDLPHLKAYYARGMVKVPPGDLRAFADAVVRLLEHKSEAKRLADEARRFIAQEWGWPQQAARVKEALQQAGVWPG